MEQAAVNPNPPLKPVEERPIALVPSSVNLPVPPAPSTQTPIPTIVIEKPSSKLPSYTVALFTVVFGVAAIIGGVMLMRRDKPLKAQATIMKADCVKNGSGNTCSLDISFKDNKENTVTTSIKLDTQTYYKHDQTVAVYYNEKNPKDVTTSNINLKTIGTVVITIGSIITLLGLIGFVIVYRRV